MFLLRNILCSDYVRLIMNLNLFFQKQFYFQKKNNQLKTENETTDILK